MTWLPFDLHPEYPPGGIPREQLHARYGDAFHERLKRSFETAGLVYNPPPDVVPNTLRALSQTELARDRGLHRPMHDRLMDAYWEEARNIGDPEVLRELAVEVGLAEDDVAAAIGDAAWQTGCAPAPPKRNRSESLASQPSSSTTGSWCSAPNRETSSNKPWHNYMSGTTGSGPRRL